MKLEWTELSAQLDGLLAADDAQRALQYPTVAPARQPVHTAYVPADKFNAHTPSVWRDIALSAMDEHGPLPGLAELEAQVRSKLVAQPIEDLRIDFEDGYGVRPDAEEDQCAVAAAIAYRNMLDSPPPFSGIRIKCLEGPVRARSIRTLGLFLQQLEGHLPAGFRITLPKVTSVAQVSAMVIVCEALETSNGLAQGRLKFEIQVETPQAILGADGTALIAPMLHAAQGRCAGLHYGTYDYSASVGIAAGFQSMEHPAADYAKSVMQVAAAGTGVTVSDGSTNVLPVGDRDAVQAAWQLHSRLVRRSLERGFYQGWDLHPAQLPTRYGATFRFYADGFTAAVQRLQTYLGRSASGILDEPATARALAGFVLRGFDCGAVDVARLQREAGAGIDLPVLQRLALQGL